MTTSLQSHSTTFQLHLTKFKLEIFPAHSIFNRCSKCLLVKCEFVGKLYKANSFSNTNTFTCPTVSSLLYELTRTHVDNTVGSSVLYSSHAVSDRQLTRYPGAGVQNIPHSFTTAQAVNYHNIHYCSSFPVDQSESHRPPWLGLVGQPGQLRH